MTGWVSFIPFHLFVWHRDPGAVRDDTESVRDDGDVVVTLNLEVVRLESVRLAAAAQVRIVRLHQALKPLSIR
jgi:hypothetical protein